MHRHRNPQARLSTRPTPDNDPTPPRDREEKVVAKQVSRPDFEYHMNGLRLAVGRTDAVADALQRYFDERQVGSADPDVAERRASHLIDLTAECAVHACEELDLACEAVGREAADERS